MPSMVQPRRIPAELVQQLVRKYLEMRERGDVPGWQVWPNGGPPDIDEKESGCGCETPMAELGKTARHSFSKCMEKGCNKPPEIECIWANGYGRAWFCKPHFKTWSTKGDGKGDIIKQRDVPDGKVPSEWSKKGVDHRSVFRVASRYLVGKYHGYKRGDGTSVGLFIPLPRGLAKKFPTLYPEDNSPSHVTFLYIGEVPEERHEELVRVLKEIFSDCWEDCVGSLQNLEYFDHNDKGRRVPHMSIAFNRDMEEFRECVKKGLADAGFPISEKFPKYQPHVTLAYLPDLKSQWDGPRPNGAWQFDCMEVWGLPDRIPRIPFGKKRARRLANLQARKAGWWAIDSQGQGIDPPVDKGSLINAIPGTDPGDASLYNGDDPMDTMGLNLDDINLQYWTAWGRPATPDELEAVFDMTMGPVRDGTFPLSRWFPGFLAWSGFEPTDIAMSLETLNALGWFFQQKEGRRREHDKDLPTIEDTLGPLRKEIVRVNDLAKQFKGDEDDKKLQEKLEKLKEEWLDIMFPSRKNAALVERWMTSRG